MHVTIHSIRTRFTLLTVCAIVVALSIATAIAVISIRNLGNNDANEMLTLLCRTGEMNLDSYFESVERSVKTVSTLVQESLADTTYDNLDSQVERARNLFGKVAYETNGVLTYYFRLNPEVSKTVKGFWYVNLDGEGFKEHEVTDITLYDTNDTSKLVWFTVPKATGEGVWLPPYFTDNLDVCVISYNAPVYWNNQFIGVIGIEIDYETLVHEVENIRIYNNGYAFLVDAEGNIIYHPYLDSASLAEQNKPQIPEGMMGDDSHVRYVYGGVEKTAVWRPLSNGMRLFVTVPIDEINSGWQGLVLSILLASLFVLVVVTIFTTRFADHLTKPLRDLTEAAKQVDGGNYDFALDYNKDDEVGILTRTFKQLATHVKDHINDLDSKVFVDALTSVRNKGGYDVYIQEIQDLLDASEEPVEFAMGVFDCDNLKMINDKYGHDKGDVYIKTASHLICHVFQHSPVFRIGGDEFAVVLRNADYQNRDELFQLFRKTREEICSSAENPWERVSVTLGLAVYDPATDDSVNDVARHADQLMYENKRLRKEQR